MSAPSVAMVSPYDLSVPGGVQGQVRALSVELARRGKRVIVVSPGSSADPTLASAGVTHLVAGRTHLFPGNGSQAPITLSINAARWAARCLLDDGVSLIHLHEPLTPLLGWPMLRSPQRALVGTFHRSGDDGLYRALGQALRPWSSNLDVSVAVSAAAATTALRCAGVRCEVLFNGIDVAALEDAEPWPTMSKVILFLGRDEPRKGRSVLLDAARTLPQDVEVWVTGEQGGDVAPDAGATVRFLGRIDEHEKLRRLAAADVLCAPSLGGESFGVVLLEGLAAGCAVVASDIDGYRQALGEHGSLVAPGDPTALSAALTEALEAPRSRSTARQAFVNRWSISKLVDAYQDCYERALGAAAQRQRG